jgi:hypothetical protein
MLSPLISKSRAVLSDGLQDRVGGLQEVQVNESARKGDWILTFSGIEFWPIDPRLEDVCIEDIAHALSMQCRYSGHVSQFYSVAEHSIRVAELVPPEDQLWALLHDASEAYLVDLPRPIKRYTEIGRHYREAEDCLMAVICERFALHPDQPESVKRADQAMLCVEAKALLPNNSWWRKWESCLIGTERPIGNTVFPECAEAAFLALYASLAQPTDPGGSSTSVSKEADKGREFLGEAES